MASTSPRDEIGPPRASSGNEWALGICLCLVALAIGASDVAGALANAISGGPFDPGHSPQRQKVEVLRQIGYLDQERPLYRSFRVDEMLRYGQRLNPNWDDRSARAYLAELGIPTDAKVGKLSVGQQAQVALTMCLAKRPSLLLLDEPVAALDPVAREGLMHVLLRSVAEDNTTVLLPSHALSDLAAVCDYVIILSASRVHVADDLDFVLASHRLLVAPTADTPPIPPGVVVVSKRPSERQIDVLVRVEEPVTDPAWRVVEPTLEEIVVAYLRGPGLARTATQQGAADTSTSEDLR